jgi:YggT family protein
MIPVILKNIVYALINIFEFLVVARAIMSFLAVMVSNPVFHRFYDIICAITEPVLTPIRKLLEKIPFLQQLPIDFSPLVVLLILSFLGNAIIWL